MWVGDPRTNKLSIRLNLKQPRGVELAKSLVGVSDIVAESFRPGVMERLGLSYEALKAVKPDIVMVSVSASGQTGPERGYVIGMHDASSEAEHGGFREEPSSEDE